MMTTKQRRWFRGAEISLWVLVTGAFAYRFLPAEPVGRITEEGAAPAFSVRTLDGRKVKLTSLRGEVVLVNFWATWCPPCRREMPGFQSVYDDYKDRGFTVIGLSADQGPVDNVRAFVRTHRITYPVAMASYEVQRLYGGVEGLPESFLLDRKGRIRKRVTGVFSEATLRRSVEQLLAEEAES